MTTSFDVVYIGNLPLIDISEGNRTVSTALANTWRGTYGSLSNPLASPGTIQSFAPGSTGFAGGISSAYDMDNNRSNDTFTIDGVEKVHDVTLVFEATLTYGDGTTADISAVMAQDTAGDVWLMPEPFNNSDAAALGAKHIAALTLRKPIYPTGAGSAYDLIANRFAVSFVPCFTPGTLIATVTGERPVETLRPGDRVITRDHGIQAVRWAGHRALGAAELAQSPEFRPVRIRAGSLAPGIPERDMLVSPNHRMLLTDETAELLFGEREVLVAAKHLVGLTGVDRHATATVAYLHLLFDHHEVILADGAWSESFQPGDYALRSVGTAQRDEILALFPDLADTGASGDHRAARLSLKAHEAALLVADRAF